MSMLGKQRSENVGTARARRALYAFWRHAHHGAGTAPGSQIRAAPGQAAVMLIDSGLRLGRAVGKTGVECAAASVVWSIFHR